MFEQSSLSTSIAATRVCSTALGLVTQAVLITAAVLVPIVTPDTLPRVTNIIGIFSPPSPPPPAPPVLRTTQPRTSVRPLQMQGDHLLAPTAIPAKPVMIDEPPLTPAETGVPGGTSMGVPGGIAGGTGAILSALVPSVPVAVQPAAPALPAPKPAAAVVIRIRRGGNVQEALLIHKVIPAYPALARQARVSGVVQLLGVVGTDGRIRELRVVEGHPLLVTAALEAVRQWIYRPTLLNGDAVEVIAPITVTFKLG